MTRKLFADRVGRSVAWVDKVERGERSLTKLPLLERVAEVLQVPMAVLTDSAEALRADQCPDPVELAAIRAALQSYESLTGAIWSSDHVRPEPDMARLRRQVGYAWSAFQASHYSSLGRLLPQLLRDTQDAAWELTGDEALAARGLLSQVYQLAAATLLKLGDAELAWLAADRGVHAARRADDRLVAADAVRRLAHSLLTRGDNKPALRLLVATAERMTPALDGASAEHLSVYGMTFLRGAIAAARTGDRATVRDLLSEADVAAASLGDDRNERWTAFGPTNVAVHRVAALVELADGALAVEAADRIDPASLARLTRERRAGFYVDLAAAHSQSGRGSDAIAHLLTAEQIAAEEVRCRQAVRNLVGDLLERSPRTPPLELRLLAQRIGAQA